LFLPGKPGTVNRASLNHLLKLPHLPSVNQPASSWILAQWADWFPGQAMEHRLLVGFFSELSPEITKVGHNFHSSRPTNIGQCYSGFWQRDACLSLVLASAIAVGRLAVFI
jgi:hypothetical protein